MAGITNSGFEPKTVDEIASDMKDIARQEYGDDIDLSPDAPLTKFINTIAYEQAQLWKQVELLYNNSFFRTASGQSLDNEVSEIGISRKPAQEATGEVTFSRETTGDEITIDKGSVVVTADENLEFETTESKVMGSSETSVTVPIESVEGGSDYNVSANTITIMETQITGIDSVTNTQETTGGGVEETDDELRSRAINSLFSSNKATTQAIRDSLIDAGADGAVVYENSTSSTDTDNRPPHSFEALITGTLTNDEIAQIIWNNKPAGIQTYGNSSGTAIDDIGQEHIMQFSTMNEIDTYVRVVPQDTLSSGSADSVKTEVNQYFDTLRAEDDVVYYQTIDAVMNVQEVQDPDVYLDTQTPASGTSNITVSSDEVANLVEVTVE